MKTAEPKTVSTSNKPKAKQPFFGKGKESFFSSESIRENSSFFGSQKSLYGYSNGPAVQTKLTIGQPNDKYEQEADATADKVVQRISTSSFPDERNNGSTIQKKQISSMFSFTPFVLTKCAHCEKEEKLQKKDDEDRTDLQDSKLQKKPIFESNAEPPPDDEKNIQRKCAECEKEDKTNLQTKSEHSTSPISSRSIESALTSSKGSGNALPEKTRSQMESFFGASFSNVRIHDDSSSAQMSKNLNAHAFTNGSDIYFNTGKYDTNSNSGKHLLAHELTHVVQQSSDQKTSELSNSTQPKQTVQRTFLEDAWGATGGKVVSGAKAVGSAVAGAATDLYNTGVDALKSLAMKLAPDLIAFLQTDIVETLKQKVIASIDSLTGGLFSRIQTEGLFSILVQLFGSGISAIGTGISASCSSLANAAKALWAFVKKLTGPAIQAFKKLMQKIGGFLSSIWDHFGKPAWEAVKHYAADVWQWIEDKAIWLWNLTAPIRKAIGEAWDWVKKQFNIAWSNTSSVLDWIGKKLSKAWDWIKAKIQPIIGPLKIIAGIALMLSPAGPIIAIYYGAPYVWSAIKWLAENFNKYIIVKAKDYLRTKILPAIKKGLTAIQSFIQTGMQWLNNLFASVVNSVSQLLNSLTTLAPFRFLRFGINRIINNIKKSASFVASKAIALGIWVKSTASQVWKFLSPIVEFLRQLFLVGVFGPLSILDDGVWSTVKSVVNFGLKVPCLREIGGFLEIPFWIEKIDGVRQTIKDVWFMIKNPDVMEAKAKIFLEPYIKDIPGKTESYLAKALAKVGLATTKHISGILKHLVPAITHLLSNWWAEAKKMIWYLIWPFAEGSPLYEDAPKLWNLVPAIWRNIFKGQFRLALDGCLEWWQAMNNVLGLFAGWIAAGGALVGAIIGAFAGGVGAIPGAGAGFEVAIGITEGLMGSMIAAELMVIGVAVYDLLTVTDDGEEGQGKNQKANPESPAPVPQEINKTPTSSTNEGESKSFNSQNIKTNRDRIEYAYQRIGNSALTLGIMGALLILGAIGGEIASALMSAVKKLGSFIGKKLPGLAKFVTSVGEAIGESKIAKGLKEVKSEFNRGRAMVKGEIPTPEKPVLDEEGRKIADADVSTDGKRRVETTTESECVICSSPCEEIHKKYKTEVESNKKIAERLEEIKNSNEKLEVKTEAYKKIEQELAEMKKANSPFDENGKLKPNTKYKAGEFGYTGETDGAGRLNRVHTEDLKLSTKDRLPHKRGTPGKLPEDHAGHLFGDRFGGSAELDNIVSQTRRVNLSEFKRIENQWAEAIRQGKRVEVEIKVNYNGDNIRPQSFEVSYKIDGEHFFQKIIN